MIRGFGSLEIGDAQDNELNNTPTGTRSHTGQLTHAVDAGPKNRRGRDLSTPQACRERRALAERVLQRAIASQGEVDTVYERYLPVRSRYPQQGLMRPGLLDQQYAVRESRWHTDAVLRLRQSEKHKLRAQGRSWVVLAATFAKPEWIVQELDPDLLLVIRKQVQRQAKRLPVGSVVTGFIDICPFHDFKSGVKGWAYHVHLTIQIAMEDVRRAKKEVQKAFPYRDDGARGVPSAREVKETYDPQGWDRYQRKVLLAVGIRQRVVRVSVTTGQRATAEKPELTQKQFTEWVKFLAKINAEALMIWVGHHRYGSLVLPMPCNR